MPLPSRSIVRFRPSLSLILLVGMFATLWVAGGASRADAAGQTVVRSVAWGALIVAILFGARPAVGASRPVVLLLAATVLLALLQLIPLPPTIWQALPGRAAFVRAAALSGQAQPWFPWAIVPSAATSAAGALIVPVTVLIMLVGLAQRERAYLPVALVGLAAAAMTLGLLQFSGVNLDNPLINDSVGEVSSIFANRNHFALFLALGCLIAPVWAFLDGRRPGWRGPVALGLVLLFALTILATGSRAGLILSVLAIGIGMILSWQEIRRTLLRAPRWAFPALVTAMVATIVIFVLLSVAADRAVSIDRAILTDTSQDMRSRALPTALIMIRTYLPLGSGLGGFDPIFRMHEPFALLKSTYFNHVHNDFLEIALDAGVPGMLLLLAGITWWAAASVRAWRAGPDARHILPKLGSAMLLLVLVASLVDYPAHTPMMMGMIVIAAVWLAGAAPRAALPEKNQHL
jgi:O-antigen ligase